MAEERASEAPQQTRRPRAPGERARRSVLERAAALATIEGLEGLSIGRLAAALGMPKSSVYGLFGSKEELQLATVDAGRSSFVDHVVTPSLDAEPGRARLLALCEGYLSYVERRVFPGGCFFVAASAEVGAHTGRVHDRVALYQQRWRELLGRVAREAHAAGELPPESDPDQLAFEVGAILTGTNILAVLHSDDAVIERARQAIRQRLES